MAKVEYHPRRTEVVVVQEEEFVLTLSREEATALLSVTGSVHLREGDMGDVLSGTYDALYYSADAAPRFKPSHVESGAVVYVRL